MMQKTIREKLKEMEGWVASVGDGPPGVGLRKGGSGPFQNYRNLLGTKERDSRKGKEKRK
jgi:hypothetical protein